jgi:hypothetical protein
MLEMRFRVSIHLRQSVVKISLHLKSDVIELADGALVELALFLHLQVGGVEASQQLILLLVLLGGNRLLDVRRPAQKCLLSIFMRCAMRKNQLSAQSISHYICSSVFSHSESLLADFLFPFFTINSNFLFAISIFQWHISAYSSLSTPQGQLHFIKHL